MKNNKQKLISAGILFLVWGLLVAFGKTPTADYVEAIKIALGATGFYHAMTWIPQEEERQKRGDKQVILQDKKAANPLTEE